MALDLSTHSVIASALFIKLDTYNSEGDSEEVTFSDYPTDIVIAGTNYTGLGQLMSVTETQSDLRITPQQISIGISGIPSANISTVFDSDIKGSNISVRRGVFNPTTGQLLPISGNPSGRFYGVVDNFSVTDDVDPLTKESSIIVVLTCSTIVGLLNRKTNGRETNPKVQKALYPGDTSMDRVANLTNANFNFGGQAG
jgi:hypothetical protein